MPARKYLTPNEQNGYLVSGKMKFTIAGEHHTAETGDSWCIGGDIDHSAEVLKDSGYDNSLMKNRDN